MSRTNRFLTAAVVAVLAVSTVVATAAAQATASITATASVTGFAPLTASGVNNLNFGSVTAGTPKQPTSLASDAGRFSISGEPSTPVTVTFTLPTVLTASGGATIPVTFGTSDGLLWNPYPTAHSTFSPAAPFATSLDATGALTIGIAGTVSPPVGTVTGTYTGTVTLTVAY